MTEREWDGAGQRVCVCVCVCVCERERQRERERERERERGGERERVEMWFSHLNFVHASSSPSSFSVIPFFLHSWLSSSRSLSLSFSFCYLGKAHAQEGVLARAVVHAEDKVAAAVRHRLDGAPGVCVHRTLRKQIPGVLVLALEEQRQRKTKRKKGKKKHADGSKNEVAHIQQGTCRVTKHLEPLAVTRRRQVHMGLSSPQSAAR